jgi:hypothetical protein
VFFAFEKLASFINRESTLFKSLAALEIELDENGGNE